MEGFERAVHLTALRQSTKKEFDEWYKYQYGETRNNDLTYPHPENIFNFFWAKIEIVEQSCVDLADQIEADREHIEELKKIEFHLHEETTNHRKHLEMKHIAVRELLESLQLAMKYASASMPDGLHIGINRIIGHYSTPQTIQNG